MVLLNPTGGLVGGDRLKTEIALGPGTHVCFTTPSATRVYRTSGPPTMQETRIHLSQGAILEYFPEHVIPHPGSALRQSLTVELGLRSRAILIDALAVGRLARGEKWVFREIESDISVFSEGRPIFLDRCRLDPRKKSQERTGGMEGLGYLASVVLLGPSTVAWEDIAVSLGKSLPETPSLFAGAGAIPRGGCLVRMLCGSAPELTDALRRLWELGRSTLFGLSPVSLRK
jgi:urease accessory protein